jgi:hypothetical protein
MDYPGRSRSKTYQLLAHGHIGGPAMGGMKPVQKRDTQLKKRSKIRKQITKSETCGRVQSTLDEIHERIRAKLDELHTDFRQLKTDLRDTNQAGSRARKDRIAGFKQALRDILAAADRADKEWH